MTKLGFPLKQSQPRRVGPKNKLSKRPLHGSLRSTLQKVPLSLIIVTVLPVVIETKLWAAVWSGIQSRAWDGTGHWAAAYIFDQSIFPETFGWMNEYFAGMPFPNFYPPVFYWAVALLHHTQLVSFASAFKLMVAAPVLLMPLAMWMLGWFLSNTNRLVATAVALGSVLLLIDVRFMGGLLAGLDYFSTFQIGLYTQPLGFVLLIAWFIVYSTKLSLPSATSVRLAVPFSALLLALTILTNFFNAVTAAVLIMATLLIDAFYYRRCHKAEDKRQLQRAFFVHTLSPFIALLLTLFWFVPLLDEYQYFVTRPYIAETGALFTCPLIAWYTVAVIGSIVWLRALLHAEPDENGSLLAHRSSGGAYLGSCIILGIALILASVVAPSWFPLQTPRFLATLTFMLAIPVGYALAAGFRKLASVLDRIRNPKEDFDFKRASYAAGLTVILFFSIALTAPNLSWAYTFYPTGKKAEIEALLDFARQHRDGRYLVEVINPKRGAAWTAASFDARALNSYLGAQGNETISGVFHEASSNVLFTLPLVNAFSNYPDSFGISSVLADDLDFVSRPLAEHMTRAHFLGIKYLVIRTPAMKDRIRNEAGVAARHDFGWWSIYELRKDPLLPIRVLSHKPALVVSSYTVKARRRNEMSFIRLVEEQFGDNWYDVLLARSSEQRIDRLQELEHFGALIVDTYEYDDVGAAYELLREFAQNRALILLSSESALFKRIQASRALFPLLEIIERRTEGPGDTVESLEPTYHYDSSSIRRQWKSARTFLERHKLPTHAASHNVVGEFDRNLIKLSFQPLTPSAPVPVVVATTFHPNWQTSNGRPIYAATPFCILTFIDKPVSIVYGRTRVDRLGIWISALTLISIALFTVWHFMAMLYVKRSKQPRDTIHRASQTYAVALCRFLQRRLKRFIE